MLALLGLRGRLGILCHTWVHSCVGCSSSPLFLLLGRLLGLVLVVNPTSDHVDRVRGCLCGGNVVEKD